MIHPVGFKHIQHLDFINTFAMQIDGEANMWHWYTSPSSVMVIHNSKITYERRTMQWQKVNPL